MTIEDVREELNAYKHNCKMIADIEGQVEFYKTKLTSCTAQLADTPKGGPTVQDKIAEYIARLEELMIEKYARLIEIENEKEIVEMNVDKLKQPYKRLLYIRYLQAENYEDDKGEMQIKYGHTARETASLIGYEYKYAQKLHKRALIEYLKIKDKKTKKEVV